ncbi:VWA domain-containing protein [Chloroflexus islandicus]|uniref:VWA domain-containing protein n=1 Tax=Chloroflexus islandicus TaxID=1707952 RepID=A0A178MIS2_9CHLR|nr:VWA domain-containing protein [Chloroflexus islandicus]OAN48622.1 VWA domain-containing protein [Chloroflexus islandicus]
MTLLAPLGLLALLALPVIVILHLWQARRRRTVVPSLLIWQQIPPRPAARRRRRLRWTLLLALHLLAALLIGLALAQPQFSLPWLGSARTTAILIDTSTSMAMREGGNTRLERARQHAATFIRQMRGADQVVLISAGPQARLIDRGGSADAARLLAAVEQITIEGAGSDVTGALTIAETFLLDQPGARVVWLTDGAVPQPDLTTLRLPVQIEVLGTAQPNRAVVTLAARTGNAGAVHVYARLANHGNQPFRGNVRLLVDEQLSRTEPVNIRPNAALELAWTLPGPAQQIRLELNGNDGLPLDDAAVVNVSGQRPINVVLVADDAPALVRALQAMPEVSLTTVDPAAFVPDPAADLTIFVNTQPRRWLAGAMLIINPPPGELLPSNGLTPAGTTLTLTPAGEALLRDVNLGGIAWGRIAAIDPPAWLTPLALSDGIPLILRGRFERSEVAVWNFDLANNPLTTRLAFPLLVARTVRDLTPPPTPAAVTLGAPLIYQADIRATQLAVIDPSGNQTTLAVQPAIPATIEPNQAGLYRVQEWAGDQLLRETQLPVNAGAIGETDPTPRVASAAIGAAPAQTPVTRAATPQPLWSWLIIGAIIVLIGEWLYIQRWPPAEAR